MRKDIKNRKFHIVVMHFLSNMNDLFTVTAQITPETALTIASLANAFVLTV